MTAEGTVGAPTWVVFSGFFPVFLNHRVKKTIQGNIRLFWVPESAKCTKIGKTSFGSLLDCFAY
jgi:hypothetical protein